jgi:hypothetical protein
MAATRLVGARPGPGRRALLGETASTRSSPGRGWRRLGMLVYAISGVCVVYLAIAGSSFYLAPLAERARHPGYWVWKSGGSMGHSLGVVGSLMMVLMLLYSVRKRVRALRRLGTLSRWLDVHIYLGVFGPLLVVLHSSFKVGGLVSLSFWSMIVVATSGVVGRFLYVQIPRTRAGDELGLVAVQKLDARLSDQLRGLGMSEETLRRLEDVVAPPQERPGILRALFEVGVGDLRVRSRLRSFTRSYRAGSTVAAARFRRVLREKAVIHRRILLWDALHELFHYWHVLHKPFAVVMYLFMLVHVGVAVMTGYGWGGGR